jgi:predicted RNA-binding protein YlxR (DUF448 family)
VAVPERTCVGCGARAPWTGLVRVRAVDGAVVVDRRRSGGRGAWMHPAVGCITRAVKRKAFARAFRGVAAVDEGRLRQELTGNGGKD